MPLRRLMWQLMTSYLLVIILAILAATWYLASSMKKFYLLNTASDLEARAILLKNYLNQWDLNFQQSEIDSLCKKLGKESGSHFTVILADGTVIGDTDDDPLRMENHASRPEIRDALSGHRGISTRYNHTLSETMMYVAEPVRHDGVVAGAVRAALPVTSIERAFAEIYPQIIIEGLLIALLAGILSFYISRRISIPLERIRRVAVAFSKGEFDRRLPPGNSIEIKAVTSAMNQMAAELKEKIETVVAQRNELDAVLSSMAEGVLAFDTAERLVSLNQAAARMLTIDSDQARGRFVQEAIRNTQLQKLVARILETGQPHEDEIEIPGERNQVVRMNGTILRNNQGRGIGALVVLNDITRVRHLEKIRRDFVANVSHELRTPITSIKGFVETLRDGALKDPRETERFLGIVARGVDRLNSIIEDLLELSKIEESDKAEIRIEEANIMTVLQDAIVVCDSKIRAKGITVTVLGDDNLSTKVNAELLEQAIVNLLDNAVKYSDTGREVKISAFKLQSEIAISVQDWGLGIEKKHLSRLFERFYTVDKARSRELGGTGLGLAIVKHIVLAHHGRIDVESAPGKGSTFTIYLPVA